ncbi:reverse transcriptase domain-containing protein [Tanacetum coccineum]
MNMLSNLTMKKENPSGSGSLPSNTIANSRGDLKAITTRSGVSYDGPTILPITSPLPKEAERELEATKDKVKTTSSESIAHVQPPVVQVPIPEPEVALKPNPKPSIPYPLRLNDQKLHEKANNQMLKFLQIFQILHFDFSFVDALLHMPKFASTFKSLLSNKEKLFKLANTPLNENCSVVLLKKLPEKLRDPDRFLIPCDFPELLECLALADLGASINLMPLSEWKKLSLPEFTPTRMTIELANRLVAYPVGVTEDVFVKVGKFHFPTDFVVVDYDVDPRVPLILGRPFLRTTRALIDVHGEELILRDGDEQLIFHTDTTLKYPNEHRIESIKMINFIDISCEDNFKESPPKADVPVENFKIYTNPLFEFDEEYISSDVNPLFNEVLEDIESEDSYVSNLDEPVLSITPLSDANEDECFDPGGDIDEINAFLDMDVSTVIEVGYHDSERDEIFLEYLLKKIAFMDSSLLFSSESEDIIFDPGISVFSFYSLEPVDFPDYEDFRARDFVHHLLELQSLSCLYMGIRYPRSY